MILAIDTSTGACSVALFGAEGALVGEAHELIGRGHAEKLVPMIEAVIGNHIPSEILVGVGPGSFTGIRVGIAAAQGMAIGWGVPIRGLSSLALIAAAAEEGETVAAAMVGGHGELFVQEFTRPKLHEIGQHESLSPPLAARCVKAPLVLGPAAERLVEERRTGHAIVCHPRAAHALRLPHALRTLEPKPLYGRPPDAKPKAA
ncbi:tRNA (adenosine(37)-N6)-threonylcarbamoyltransferase complex dimerization subunit type 1 TsaB [Sphingomicrobium nitratireducens]|uniref:tRNA (adenosine(37)-N6)-threonylcarbamoyltransferase complex dimerization subunit type 1 TsaB n=1 Tax=Sphingomicrobium nitratireducens TaxID=2964666 RepID=UPI00223FF70B